MDRLIYTAMSGAKALLDRQSSVANNLANVNSTGFRAETMAFRVAPVVPAKPGEGQMTRYMSVESTPGFDQTPGPVQTTARDLDAAINGPGWFAVQADDGTEAYTRDGHFEVNEAGLLVTSNGRAVIGEGGPINVPADNSVSIGADGTITAFPPDQKNSTIQVGRLKLVNPDAKSLVKGLDGLVRTRDGSDAEVDPTVRVAGGSLEGSNVNPVEAMVSMIALARQFDTQMQMIKTAETNGQASTKLLTDS
ncbi:flagellar basal-body rod protein FlgF [soil metagenome]